MGNEWPSVKARVLLRLLERELGYCEVRRTGSHRKLRSPGYPDITFAFHDGVTVSPRLVRIILVQQVGLSLDKAKELIKRA
ncbi:type II toxin-antitoxin system HicA family toxin [Longispora albida]|uniref:type II toxin-antitoxin system HicA family toxin n=1 Tax=Longispora albida TaxID=203523 RepID=UPI0004780B15